MTATRESPRVGPDAAHAMDPIADRTSNERSAPPTRSAGAGTHLSPEWMRERGLPLDSRIELDADSDGSLMLRPAIEPVATASFTVPASAVRPSEHLFRELVAAYLGGATEFSVVEPGGLRPATRQVVRAFTERTGSSRVVSDDDTVILLRDGSSSDAAPLAELLHRMYGTVRAIQETAGAFLESTPPVDASGLAVIDDDVDRQAWRVERILMVGSAREPARLGGARAPPDPVSPILLARALERIADHAVVLGEHAARLAEWSIPDPIRSSLGAFHRQALDYLDSAFAVAEAPDARRANELLDTGAALHAALRSLSESFLVRGAAAGLSPRASADLGIVLQSLDRTVAYSEDLAEVGLDRAVAAQLTLESDQDSRRDPPPTPSRGARSRSGGAASASA